MALAFDTVGQGPNVVLVNGASPMAWGALPERLASTHHRAITYGRRGFPPNDGRGVAASLREHSDDLVALLRECGRATVVGWSSGGVVALDAAVRSPDLMSKLVILEAPLHAKRRPTLGLLRAVVGAQLKGRKDAARGARHFLAWALRRSDGRPNDLTRLDPQGVEAAAPGILTDLVIGTGEREIAMSDLAQLEVDTTWLIGTASIPSIQRLARRAERRSRRITVKPVPGAGHAIALDAPERVVAEIGARGGVGRAG